MLYEVITLKYLSLAQGGRRVAEALGGRPILPETRDPAERRLRNLVEEMAIAAGLPVPPVYLLDEEPGINAFAAGRGASTDQIQYQAHPSRALVRPSLLERNNFV